MAIKKRVVATFDFDETLISRDTLPDFLYSSFPLPVFAIKVLISIPMLVQFRLHEITNDTAKERLLTTFVKGMPIERFAQLCESYRKRLDTIANPEALARVKWHQDRGDEVVIISASPENWIKPWAEAHGIQTIISTKLAVQNGKLTGKLATSNCHGPEKVRRFKAAYPKRDNYVLCMYGDGKSDQAMFEYADKPYEKTFDDEA